MPERATVPARKGKATTLRQGQTIAVINTHGQQVVDTWAFNSTAMDEFMSMEHTHTQLLKIIPTAGDTLYSNRRNPILTFVEDTSGGVHDTLIAACDKRRYELLGVRGPHDSCADNLHAALAELGLKPPEIPAPLNLFMNIPVRGAAIAFETSAAPAGSRVVFRAEMDLVIVFSSCPQDVVPISGTACVPKEVQFEISG